MPAFGRTSENNLRTCDPVLQLLFRRVVEDFDCSINTGHRGQLAQDRAFADGNSEKEWPDGKHNVYPSEAVDAYPYPLPDWKDTAAFVLFAGRVMGVAAVLGISLRWGGFWKSKDYGHFELIDA
jgi:hypothetical protein